MSCALGRCNATIHLAYIHDPGDRDVPLAPVAVGVLVSVAGRPLVLLAMGRRCPESLRVVAGPQLARRQI